MEDVSTEELPDSDYSDTFVASSDNEDGLNWDSGDSRPPGPSPPSSANMNESSVVSLSSPRREIFDALPPGILPGRMFTRGSDPFTRGSDPFDPSSFGSPINSSASSDDDSNFSDLEYTPNSPSYSPPGYRQNPLDLPFEEDAPHSPAYSPPEPRDPDPDVDIIEEGTANQQIPQEIPRVEPPPPAQATNDDVAIQPQSTNSTDVSEPKADPNISTVSEEEDGSLCSICMDPLTNSGKHRVVCLKCGHIFGHNCVERWIKVGCTNGAKRCPTCNKKAALKDIRMLYLPKVIPIDTTERDRLIQEKEEMLSKKIFAEKELSRCKYMCQISADQYKDRLMKMEYLYEDALETIEQLSKERKIAQPGMEHTRDMMVSRLLHTIQLSRGGGCRVLAFNHFREELVVSQPSSNKIFAGYGIRVLNTIDFLPSRFIHLHQKMIRDLSFHSSDKNLLLSVSLDHSAKLVDLSTNTTCHTFRVEDALWSCCWDMTEPNLLILGSQQGRVFQFDRRMLGGYVNLWEIPNNMTPVVALTSTPSAARTPFPQGGFISCRLNRIFTHARHGEEYTTQELNLEGPFMSMRYDYTTQNLFTTSRPSSRSLYTQICLNQMDVDEQGKVRLAQIHTFNCGTTARVLSRMNTIPALDDTMVIGHHESGRTVNMWSSKSGNLMHSIPVKEPIIDVAGINIPDEPWLLATLSESRVCVYNIP